MKLKSSSTQSRLNLIGAIILLVGLGSAILIYLIAENDLKKVLGYEVAGEGVYPITPEDSRMYVHDMELFGGKAAVLANEFRNWFDGLWHGKSLAFTVACISIIISFGFFFVAKHIPFDLTSNERGENSRHGKYFKP
jgi:hypothetical protein